MRLEVSEKRGIGTGMILLLVVVVIAVAGAAMLMGGGGVPPEDIEELGVRAVPAVVVDGELASCCRGVGATEEDLRAAGIGQSLP